MASYPPPGKSASKKRRTKKKRHVILSLVCAFASFAAVVAAICAAITVFFKINDISVSGTEIYLASDIIKTSGIKEGQNMFSFNKFAVIDKIKRAYPYLKDVEINRKLPDKLVFSLSEYASCAYVQGDDSTWIISYDGKILKQVASGQTQDELSSLVKIDGVTLENPICGENLSITEKDKKKPLLDILQIAKKSDIINKVIEINLEKLYRISFFYDNRFTVKLGSADEIDRKLSFLLSIENNLISTDRGIIDVSDTQKARFIPINELEEDPLLVKEPENGTDDGASD